MCSKSKKGFTLIELIVVMAVIGILVLLAMPKFMGYTEKARATEIKSNIKQLENASERYYIDKQDWPRLSDTPYTADKLESFAQEIKDKTGQIVTIDPSGKYYDIDYNKLQKYVQKPKDGINYVIQNPVGEVYYLEGLTAVGQERFNPNNKPTAVITMTPEQNINANTSITWNHENSTDPDGDEIINAEWDGKQETYNAGSYTVKLRVQDSKGMWSDWTSKTFTVASVPGFVSAPSLENIFDNNANTYTSSTGSIIVDMQKDLTNHIISVTMAVGSFWTGDGFQGYLEVLNSSGAPISFMNADNDVMQTYIKVMATSPETNSKRTFNIIVPNNASKIRVRAASEYSVAYFYELKESADQQLPNPVSNLTYTSTDSSVTLNWTPVDDDYGKVAIYQDGKFVSYATGNSYTTPTILYSSTNYTYDIRTIDTSGNRSNTTANIVARTKSESVTWRGCLNGSVFDGDLNTYTSSTAGQTATWVENIEGRTVAVTMAITSGWTGDGFQGYLEVLNGSGAPIAFVNNATGISTTYIKVMATGSINKQTFNITIPTGAAGIRVRPASEYSTAYIYEIQEK